MKLPKALKIIMETLLKGTAPTNKFVIENHLKNLAFMEVILWMLVLRLTILH